VGFGSSYFSREREGGKRGGGTNWDCLGVKSETARTHGWGMGGGSFKEGLRNKTKRHRTVTWRFKKRDGLEFSTKDHEQGLAIRGDKKGFREHTKREKKTGYRVPMQNRLEA